MTTEGRFDPACLALAEQILAFSRKQLSQAVPALTAAVYGMRAKPCRNPGAVSADGERIYFHPQSVVRDFRKDPNGPALQLLHVTLHFLLGHPGMREKVRDLQSFDALADFKVELLAEQLAGAGFRRAHVDLSLGGGQGPALGEGSYTDFMRRSNTDFTGTLHLPMPALYRAARENDYFMVACSQYRERHRVDNHSLWTAREPEIRLRPEQVPDHAGETRRMRKWRKDGREPLHEAQDEDERAGCGPDGPDWRWIRAEILRDLPGTGAGTLRAELEAAEGDEISYREFLREFAFCREQMLLDFDSFDPRWYRMGLELYGNVPLIEPSEVSEPPRPDELAVALDASRSISDADFRGFLRETLNLLDELSYGVPCFRVLLLQFDDGIRWERLLNGPESLDELPELFRRVGYGGTSFRSVFERVEQLRGDGTLQNLRGAIVFTDANGDYPDSQPDYPVAFLVPKGAPVVAGKVPPWVTLKALDQENGIMTEVDT